MFKQFILGLISCLSALVYAAPINIVAAENFYGALAAEIGGTNVTVQSIISNPEADPHLFATSAATNRALSQAQIIIYNGADYDPWMEQLLNTLDQHQVTVINVATLMNIKAAANPHIWYQPETFPRLAQLLERTICQLNPAATSATQANLTKFLAANHHVAEAIKQVKAQYGGTKVTATEPVFGYMAEAMGFKMYGLDFQGKIMNNSEASPKMIAAYQQLLTSRQVKILFYNRQVKDTLTANMQNLAKMQHIAVVGVTETMPTNLSINQWLTQEIMASAAAAATK